MSSSSGISERVPPMSISHPSRSSEPCRSSEIVKLFGLFLLSGDRLPFPERLLQRGAEGLYSAHSVMADSAYRIPHNGRLIRTVCESGPSGTRSFLLLRGRSCVWDTTLRTTASRTKASPHGRQADSLCRRAAADHRAGTGGARRHARRAGARRSRLPAGARA